jgi:CheY-like chemotaxis protein
MDLYPVLLVGGPPRVRERVQSTLERAGYSVVLASGWEEGVLVARRTRPRLLLLVPDDGECGAGALRQLRSHPVTHRIPVLALSDGTTVSENVEIPTPVDSAEVSEPWFVRWLLGEVQYADRTGNAGRSASRAERSRYAGERVPPREPLAWGAMRRAGASPTSAVRPPTEQTA